MKKKSFNLLLCVVLAVSMLGLAACGSSSSSSSSEDAAEDETAGEATEEVGESAGEAASSEEEDAEAEESVEEVAEDTETASGTTVNEELTGTITIWDWDTTTQEKYVEKFNEVYPNVTVELVDVSWDDYMTKLQTSYVSGMELPDIILGEIAWRGTLFEMGICENLEEDPYNLDRNDMVSSSVLLSSDSNGNIVGIDTQVTPSGFAYKRDVALEYLGTDDPEEVGAMIADWDSFLEVGLDVLEKSDGTVKMMASLGDVLLCTIGQNAIEFSDGTNVDITSKMTEPLEITMKLRDAGIIGDYELYSAAWYNAYASHEILFYECAAWAPSAVIQPYAPDEEGNWAITLPPGGSFNQGGTTVSIYSGSENKEAAWAYIQYTFFSEEGAINEYELTGNYSSYLPYYEGENSPVGQEGPLDSYFGGQSLVDYYINQAAPNAVTVAQTKYDAIVSDVFQALTPSYMTDTSIDAEKALEMFIEEVELADPDANVY